MLIGSKQMFKTIKNWQPKVKIENVHIKQVRECKTRGVTVDQHLSWKSNTENICKKITSGISALRRLKDFVDRLNTSFGLQCYCSPILQLLLQSVGCVW